MHHINTPSIEIKRCLKKFGGVKRRQEVRGRENGVTVIDDFAHHPTAVFETLNGLKMAYQDSRLVAVFEPRTNSSRRSIFQKRYVDSFESADMVIIREPVPLTDIPEEDHFSSAKLSLDLQKKGQNALAFNTTNEILGYLENVIRSGDVVAVLSNGGFDNIHERLLDRLRGKGKDD